MLTVLTWFWRQPGGRFEYRAEHVNRWAAQVRANLTIPHRIACVTDIPEGLDPDIEIIAPPGDFEGVSIPSWGPKMPQCLRRLAMFRPDAAEIFGERFVCMDIDCVIAGSLDPLFDHDDDFRMYQGTSRKRPYNGSMLQMTAGARPQVYTEFTPERAAEAGQRFVGSDQAWISHVLGWGEKTWGPEDGVLWYCSRYNAKAPVFRVMFFAGALKPWHLVGPLGIELPPAEIAAHTRIGGSMKIKMKGSGEITDRNPEWLANRLVKLGLAEEVVDAARAPLELPPVEVSMSMLRRDLVAIAEERGIAIEGDDNKASIIAKINAAPVRVTVTEADAAMVYDEVHSLSDEQEPV